ncbi:hypothetical protein D3C81_1533160 [compost metagenome]
MDWGAKGMLMPQGVASRTRFAKWRQTARLLFCLRVRFQPATPMKIRPMTARTPPIRTVPSVA